jgi:hypothetical protein
VFKFVTLMLRKVQLSSAKQRADVGERLHQIICLKLGPNTNSVAIFTIQPLYPYEENPVTHRTEADESQSLSGHIGGRRISYPLQVGKPDCPLV